MSCLRIRSRRRSRGPSYTSATATANGKSLSSLFPASFAGLAADELATTAAGTDARDGSPETNLVSSIMFVIHGAQPIWVPRPCLAGFGRDGVGNYIFYEPGPPHSSDIPIAARTSIIVSAAAAVARLV